MPEEENRYYRMYLSDLAAVPPCTPEEMEHLIPSFVRHTMTSRQKLLTCSFVKELYDHREEYQRETRTLTNAVSSMLLKEIYKGGNA